jgi:hypothetical protein
MLCNARVPGKYLGLGDKLQALPMAVMIVIYKLQSANWSSRGQLVHRAAAISVHRITLATASCFVPDAPTMIQISEFRGTMLAMG